MRKLESAAAVFLLMTVSCLAGQAPTADPKMKSFVRRLMGKMTLDEKIGQLNLVSVGFDVTGPRMSEGVEENIQKGLVGGVFNTYTPVAVRKLQELAISQSRLHIPLIFGYDVIHGHRTIFPVPLGLSCSWDPELIGASARVAATEASADGLDWTFAPMVDIARDPRWGRIAEGAGEDPYLGGRIAAAMVRGFQGGDLKQADTVMACVKHFALYGAAEAGRDYNGADMSLLKMYQYYLPPYKAALDAGAGSAMSAFNEVNGIPATGNRWLLTDLLRKQWGFQGFVVSDYAGVNEMTSHGMGDAKKDAELALNAGLDMDMVDEAFLRYLKPLIQEGAVRERAVSEACERILNAKYKLGLFDDPYRRCNEERARTEILTPEHRHAARDLARRSFVLLKNDGRVLPLKKSGTIALVGPLAADRRNLLGSWSGAGDWRKAISVSEGISNVVGSAVEVIYSKGANLIEEPALLQKLNAHRGDIVIDKLPPDELLAEAVSAAKRADVVVAVLGESHGMSGEGASRSDLNLPGCQRRLLEALVETGKPVAVVLMNGRPLTLTWEAEHCAAILETWFGGTEAGNAIADVLFGDYSPSGKLTATFPRSVGQIPIYYSHKNTGRPYAGNPLDKFKSRYLDVPNDPLYPFGYGLSYSAFAYSDVRLSQTKLKGNETLAAAVTVTNIGSFAAEEIVQLYLSAPVASVTRSVEDLINFQKIRLEPGESREVLFRLTTEDLKFFNNELKYDWEPGEFILRAGPNSAEVKSATVSWGR